MTTSTAQSDPLPRERTAQRVEPRRRTTAADADESCLFLRDEQRFSERLATLSGKQRRILALMACGLLNKQIAFECGVTDTTVKSHVSLILRRLSIRSRTEAAVRYALHMERHRHAILGEA